MYSIVAEALIRDISGMFSRLSCTLTKGTDIVKKNYVYIDLSRLQFNFSCIHSLQLS